MSLKSPSAQDDLAFMRALVDSAGGSGLPVAFGEGYFAAGLIYGLQTLSAFIQMATHVPYFSSLSLVFGIAPTAIFIVAIGWIIWRHRGEGEGGVTARAVGATFGCLGLANFALICVIGSVAYKEHSLVIWWIYPCVVLVTQGAAWLVASSLRRSLWPAVVALGWFAGAIAAAQVIDQPMWFVFVLTLCLLGLMAVPGLVMMRQARNRA
jgi:hypothetical protein